MSEFDDYFEDEEFYWEEDGPIDAVDDLVEHAVHSPVWNDHDPSYNLIEYWSDWDYYSDDYYDEDQPRRISTSAGSSNDNFISVKKRRTAASEGGTNTANTDLESVDLGSPLVVWRTGPSLCQRPKFESGNGQSVALLKDWRDRFEIKSGKDRDLVENQDPQQNEEESSPFRGTLGVSEYSDLADRGAIATRPTKLPPEVTRNASNHGNAAGSRMSKRRKTEATPTLIPTRNSKAPGLNDTDPPDSITDQGIPDAATETKDPMVDSASKRIARYGGTRRSSVIHFATEHSSPYIAERLSIKRQNTPFVRRSMPQAMIVIACQRGLLVTHYQGR
ncbi:MAG: hypothetical protein M1827_004545 [Pycnora praestabilis]|nr:MAG: hypothetical protein M1827_004545 [Pycnora praestabilis]